MSSYPPENSQGQQYGSASSRPSWYSYQEQTGGIAGTGEEPQAVQSAPTHATGPKNPYADQPLAGPWSGNQPQETVMGEYPVVSNGPGEGWSQPGTGFGQDPDYSHHPQGYGYPQNFDPYASQSKGFSIASLVIGIASLVFLWMFFIPPVVGVVLGHIGRKKEPAGRGLALGGLITSYIALSFVVGFFLLIILGIALGLDTSDYEDLNPVYSMVVLGF